MQLKAQEGGFLSHPSPNNAQQSSCFAAGKLERKDRDTLLKGWFTKPGPVDFVALSTSYLGQAVWPLGPDGSHCALVAENRGDANSPYRSTLFRAALAWSPQDLAPGASTTYRQAAFFGPVTDPNDLSVDLRGHEH